MERITGFTFVEAAPLLGLSESKLRQLEKDGAIGCFRLGRKKFIGQRHIDEFLAKSETKPRDIKQAVSQILRGAASRKTNKGS